MTPVTLALLRKVSPMAPVSAAELCPHIDTFAPKYGIDTPKRLAMFLAQAAHETGGFRYLKEIWGPTPAQRRYEGRKDLGNVTTGDGYRFRGRGIFQTTGRANYLALGKALGIDYMAAPELLEWPYHAVLSACYFWASHGLNVPADQGNVKRATLIINGGTNGLREREAHYKRACAALGIYQ